MDPSSTDITNKISIKYSNLDKRIDYKKYKERLTVGKARNKAVSEYSNYDYICYHDVDDIMVNKRLEYSVNNIGNNDIIYGNMKCFGEDNEVRRSLPYINYEILLMGNHIQAGTTMFTYEIWEKLGGFDETMFGSSDYDFWLRAAEKKSKFKYLNKILIKYRVHYNSISEKYKNRQLEDSRYAKEKHNIKNISIKSKLFFNLARFQRYIYKIFNL
jgi:hypothetical protein